MCSCEWNCGSGRRPPLNLSLEISESDGVPASQMAPTTRGGGSSSSSYPSSSSSSTFYLSNTHTHSYIIYIYIYICVCVCVFLYLYFPHRFISMMCPFLPTWWMLELRRRRRRIGVWRRCAMKYMTSHRSSRVIGSRFEFVVVAVATVRPSQGLMLSPPLCLTFAMIHLFGSVFLLSIHLKVVEGWKEVEVSHGR